MMTRRQQSKIPLWAGLLSLLEAEIDAKIETDRQRKINRNIGKLTARAKSLGFRADVENGHGVIISHSTERDLALRFELDGKDAFNICVLGKGTVGEKVLTPREFLKIKTLQQLLAGREVAEVK